MFMKTLSEIYLGQYFGSHPVLSRI